MALSNPIIAGALQFLGGTANAYKEERDKRTAVANKRQMMGMEQQNKLDTMSHEQMLRQEEATRTSNTPTAKANERKAIADAKYAENRVGEPIKALQKRLADAERAKEDAIKREQATKDKIKATREQKEYEKQYDETVRALSDRLEAYRNGDPSEDMDTLRKFVKKHRATLQGEHNQIPFPDAKKIADGEIIERNLSPEEWEQQQVVKGVLGEGQFPFGAHNMKPKAPLGQDAPATIPAGDVPEATQPVAPDTSSTQSARSDSATADQITNRLPPSLRSAAAPDSTAQTASPSLMGGEPVAEDNPLGGINSALQGAVSSGVDSIKGAIGGAVSAAQAPRLAAERGMGVDMDNAASDGGDGSLPFWGKTKTEKMEASYGQSVKAIKKAHPNLTDEEAWVKGIAKQMNYSEEMAKRLIRFEELSASEQDEFLAYRDKMGKEARSGWDKLDDREFARMALGR